MEASAAEKILRLPDARSRPFRRLFPAMDRLVIGPHLKRAFLGERACGIGIFDDLRRGLVSVGETGLVSTGEESKERKSPVSLFYPGLFLYLLRPWFDADEAAYLRLLGEWIRLAEKPYEQSRGEIKALEAEFRSLSKLNTLTQLLLPALSAVKVKATMARARLDLARLAILASEYREDRGHYPERLEDLLGKELAAVPVDPFSGGPYRYVRRGGIRLIYSIGRNGVDDGGKPGELLPDGDIVWTLGPLKKGETK